MAVSLAERDLLEAGEATNGLIRLIASGIEQRRLQGAIPVVPRRVGRDDVIELVSPVRSEGDESFEVHAIPVGRVTTNPR